MGWLRSIARAAFPRPVRNWLRSPNKTVSWAWSSLQGIVGIKHVAQVRPGWSLLCHPLAYRASYYAQCEDPAQVAEFDNFVSHCRPGMIFFDIGAHFGIFSLAAVHWGGPNARAVAVDASPVATRMIEYQAAANNVAERIRVLQACVCESSGVRDMIAVGVLADGYYAAPQATHTSSDMTKVVSVTLDELVRQTGLLPTHLKIDVEGFEGQVLRGGRELLAQQAGLVIFLELHNKIIREEGRNPETVLDELTELGYRIFLPDGRPVHQSDVLTMPLIRLVVRRPEASVLPSLPCEA